MTHTCLDHGHVWLETDGTPYTRHRGRLDADVSVVCKHCGMTSTLPRSSGFSGARKLGQPIDLTIPPQFMAVLNRATEQLAADIRAANDASFPTGPVPKPE